MKQLLARSDRYLSHNSTREMNYYQGLDLIHLFISIIILFDFYNVS